MRFRGLFSLFCGFISISCYLSSFCHRSERKAEWRLCFKVIVFKKNLLHQSRKSKKKFLVKWLFFRNSRNTYSDKWGVFGHEDCCISVILLWVVSRFIPYVHSPWHDANKCMVEWSTYHLFLQSQREMAAKIRKLLTVPFFVACAIFVPQESAGDLLDPTLIGRELQSFANDALGVDDLQVRSHLC